MFGIRVLLVGLMGCLEFSLIVFVLHGVVLLDIIRFCRFLLLSVILRVLLREYPGF